jgi:MFS family permease
VTGTVVLLGLVSMLTDVSSESVNAVLPIYLATVVGLGPLGYGFVDGLYQGVSTLVRVAGGWMADAYDRPKWVSFAGYAVSAASRVALLAAQGVAVVAAVVTADRLGKGLRTAPRDALISASTPAIHLGNAFGVHRAMDTAGALIGPVVAFVVLIAVPQGYHAVFVVSFAFAVAGLAVLGFLVPDVRRAAPSKSTSAGVPAQAPCQLDQADPSDTAPTARPAWRLLAATPSLRRLLLGAGVLAVLTIGDGFLYLALQDRDQFAARFFPLLYVGTNAAYLALAVPLGRLADRMGRARVLVLGHLSLLAAYVCALGVLTGPVATLSCLALLGAFYAATDGVLAALASCLVPAPMRATGIAAAQTVVAGGRLVASVLFGLAWTLTGRDQAVLGVALVLAAAIPLVLRLLRGVEPGNAS